MCQNNYLSTITEIKIDRTRDINSPLNDDEIAVVRTKLGQLSWAARQTRPDIAFEVCEMSGKIKIMTIQDLKRLNKIIRQTHNIDVKLKYKDVGNEMAIYVFSDASFGNLNNGGSQGGHVICISGTKNLTNIISWKSSKLRRVVKSTLSSETLALSEAVDNGHLTSVLLGELLYNAEKAPKMICYVDNGDLVEALKSSKQVSDKRLRIEIAYIKEMKERGEIYEVRWVPSDRQIANCLTKRCASPYSLLDIIESNELSLNF